MVLDLTDPPSCMRDLSHCVAGLTQGESAPVVWIAFLVHGGEEKCPVHLMLCFRKSCESTILIPASYSALIVQKHRLMTCDLALQDEQQLREAIRAVCGYHDQYQSVLAHVGQKLDLSVRDVEAFEAGGHLLAYAGGRDDVDNEVCI